MANWIQILLDKLHNYQKPQTKKRPKKEIDYSEPRKLAGSIIIAVLTERIPVQKGLLMFPKNSMEDPSLQAAWHALCHYEADEDIKRRDIEYANEQLELMELIAFTFKDGKDLPQNIIHSYSPYYDEALIAPEKGINGLLSRLLRYINL